MAEDQDGDLASSEPVWAARRHRLTSYSPCRAETVASTEPIPRSIVMLVVIAMCPRALQSWFQRVPSSQTLALPRGFLALVGADEAFRLGLLESLGSLS